MEKTLNLQSQYGGEIKVSLEINTYLNNGCMYIGLVEQGEYPEPYGDLTVNLMGKVPDYCGYVDLKCYRFQDINYTTATEDEQIGIFERYCKFLNSLDCNFKITVNNKNKNMIDLREKVLLAYCDDGYDHFRKIYNDIIEEKIREGRQGIEQERYLTITIERNNFEEAKAQFAT